MELGLREKVAVITGGSTGIGLAVALEFAREGCKIAICGRDEKKLEAAAEQFHQQSFPVYTESVDVTVADDISRFAGNVAARFGRIDVWVNNAGIAIQKPFLEMTLEEWELDLRTNLTSVFWGTRTAAGYMMKSGGGVVINTSSFAAIIPRGQRAAYAASKAGMKGLTKVSAGELAPYHIRVNSVISGTVDTPRMKNRLAAGRDKIVSTIALQRIAQPAELATVYTFLASDAASFITGAEVEVTGGKLCIQDPREAWNLKTK